uniref:Uncharacterized protein n=1 Tax=Proboscia inermis TaxID=420281 RepID=A0A7S0G969_9STRA
MDAPLTDKGRNEAAAVRVKARNFQNPPELVVTSPLCRAVQTAIIAFSDHLPQNINDDNRKGNSKKKNNATIPFVAHDLAREDHGVHICDKRRPRSQQGAEFPQVDFTMVKSEEDDLFRNDQRESADEVCERIYQFLEWLRDRSEENIAVTTHSGWLMSLFNGVLECDESLKVWFGTGEMRSVKLVFQTLN